MRALELQDAPAVVDAIHSAFAQQEVVTDPPPGALHETAATIRALIEAGGGAGMEHGAGFSAVVLWRELEGGLYFGRLAVRPSHRGCGLARRLVMAAEDEARRRGLGRVHCGARLALPGNHRLFVSCGYAEFRRPVYPRYGRVVSADFEKHL